MWHTHTTHMTVIYLSIININIKKSKFRMFSQFEVKCVNFLFWLCFSVEKSICGYVLPYYDLYGQYKWEEDQRHLPSSCCRLNYQQNTKTPTIDGLSEDGPTGFQTMWQFLFVTSDNQAKNPSCRSSLNTFETLWDTFSRKKHPPFIDFFQETSSSKDGVP